MEIKKEDEEIYQKLNILTDEIKNENISTVVVDKNIKKI